MLIPIGSWCRTAYQVNEFKKNNGIKPISFPFDWTITPFSSLEIIFNKQFSPNQALDKNHIRRSKFGSLVDDYTTLIHHHDFLAPKLKELEDISGVDAKGLPFELYNTDLLAKASGRLTHTYHQFELLKDKNEKLFFVRWQKQGHPDNQLPEAFENESISTLSSILRSYLGHDNFSVLIIKSQIIDGELPVDVIPEYIREKSGVSSTIIERRGFNGDGTNNFKGDTKVWNTILSKFLMDEESR